MRERRIGSVREREVVRERWVSDWVCEREAVRERIIKNGKKNEYFIK